MLKDGRTSIEDDPRSGPFTSNDGQQVGVRLVICSNRYIDSAGSSRISWHFKNFVSRYLGMQCVAVKFVPRLLTSKNRRVKSDKNSFTVKRMIKTFKKSLQVKGHGFTDIMSKQKPNSSRLVSKTSPRPKNARQVRSNVKVMFDFF
jgi:hypothetical protein